MNNDIRKSTSSKVKELLLKFYIANFLKAGADPVLAQEIISKSFLQTDNEESLKKEINKLFSKSKTQLSKFEHNVETDPSTLFDYSTVTTFVDYGANKLETINRVGNRLRTIKELIAIDVIPQNNKFKFPERSRYIQIQEDSISIPLESQSVDLINVQYVFHHFKSDNLIDEALKEFNRILNKNGRVILWEETFEKNPDINLIVKENNKFGIFTDYDLTKQFYDLNVQERLDFIFINDWIINVNNPHMQWTMLYKSWEGWIFKLQKSNFKIQKYMNLGLRISGQLKKGVQIVGEFVKIEQD